MSRHFSAIPHCSWGAGHRKKYTPRNQCRYHSLQLIDNKRYGGEGWIRTLGTGVSPYNGLAKGSLLTALTRFQGFTVRPNHLSWTQIVSFGSYCAPLCAPQFQDVQVFPSVRYIASLPRVYVLNILRFQMTVYACHPPQGIRFAR